MWAEKMEVKVLEARSDVRRALERGKHCQGIPAEHSSWQRQARWRVTFMAAKGRSDEAGATCVPCEAVMMPAAAMLRGRRGPLNAVRDRSEGKRCALLTHLNDMRFGGLDKRCEGGRGWESTESGGEAYKCQSVLWRKGHGA